MLYEELEKACPHCLKDGTTGIHGQGFCTPFRSTPTLKEDPLSDLYPEIVIPECRMDTSLGGFAKMAHKAANARVIVPDVGCRGWLKSLYRSGLVTAERFANDFYHYETDLILFGNSLRVTDIFGLQREWVKEVTLANWLHSAESLNPIELQDWGSWFNNLANFKKAHKIYGASEFMREGYHKEIQVLNDDLQTELKQKFEVVNMGYDYKRFMPYVRKEPRQRDIPKILWSGRLDFDRKPADFARIILALAKSEDFRLILCCKPLTKRCPAWKEMVESLGDRIEHYGFATGEDYAKLIADADIIISPYNNETFGFAVAEAVFTGAFPLLVNAGAYPYLYPKDFLYNSEKEAVQKAKELLELIRLGNSMLTEFFYLLEPIRNRIIREFDSSCCGNALKESLRCLWVQELRKAAKNLSPSATKAAHVIEAGPVTKKDLMLKFIGWQGLDWYTGLRNRLLFNGYRTYIEDNEVVWYKP